MSLEKINEQEFLKTMQNIGEQIIVDNIVNNVESAVEVAKKVNFPVLIKTIDNDYKQKIENINELEINANRVLEKSETHEIIIEKEVTGWKEIDFVAVRDRKGNVIIVCTIENFMPVGLYNGIKINIIPAQTLGNKEYQVLRKATIKIASTFKMIGICHVKFALNPESFEYIILDVSDNTFKINQLIMKATKYPIKDIASKLVSRVALDDIKDEVDKRLYACIEPVFDSISVMINMENNIYEVKDLDVIKTSDNLEYCLVKAFAKVGVDCLSTSYSELEKLELIAKLGENEDDIIEIICESIRKEISVEQIHKITGIDRFFIGKLYKIIRVENELKLNNINLKLLRKAQNAGFSEAHILRLTGKNEQELLKLYKK